jgi:uncharacterized membrane protein YkoI
MRLSRYLVLSVVLAGVAPGWAAAAEHKACLSQEERRAIISSHKAVSLARAIRVVKSRLHGDIVKARLCRHERGLVYVLTVLARDGKVIQARVDAAQGKWLDGASGG